MEIELVDLTLERVSGGSLEARFQELLQEVMAINEGALAYVGSSDGSRTTVIKLEVEVRHRPAMGGDPATTTLISGAEISKRPKRNKTAQSAHVSPEGTFVVPKVEPEQMSAFTGQGVGGVVTPLASAGNGGKTNDGE